MIMARITLAVAAAVAVLASSTVNAAPMPTGTWPTSTGAVQSAKPIVVAAGTVFDGKMQTYDRSDIMCKGGNESTSETVVFLVEPGATLKNVIIGKNQMDGVYCEKSDCTIENVWWDDVCEDALVIKGGSISSVSRVIGGGARYADDKVIEHKGAGSVSIDGFYADDFGKLYRSCGTCGAIQRTVSVSNVYAVSPQISLVTVNSNYGDVAALHNISIKSTNPNVTICGKTTGGGEPQFVGDDVDGKVCRFSTGDVLVNGVAVAVAATTTATTTVTTTATREAAGAEAANEADVLSAPEPAQVKLPAPWSASADDVAALALLSVLAQSQGAQPSSFGFAPQVNTGAGAPATNTDSTPGNSFGFANAQ